MNPDLGLERERSFASLGTLKLTKVRMPSPRRWRRRSSELICHIDVIGFFGVTFVMLTIFMAQPLHPHGGTSVDMAKVSRPINMRAADKEDAIIIAITREDKVIFRKERVRVEWLPRKIRDAVKNGAENRVYIKSDGRAKYGWVKEVLDEVQASGVEKVGFLVDQRKPLTTIP